MVNNALEVMLTRGMGELWASKSGTHSIGEHYTGTLLLDGENVLIQGQLFPGFDFCRYLLKDYLGGYLIGWYEDDKLYFAATTYIDDENFYTAINGRVVVIQNPNDKHLIALPVKK